MPSDQGEDDAPELPWVERRPIARLAAFGDKTDKPVITAKALRERGETLVRLGAQVRRCLHIYRELHEGLLRFSCVAGIVVAGAPFEQLFWLGQRRRDE